MTGCLALAWLIASPQVRLLPASGAWLETGVSAAVAKSVSRTKATRTTTQKSRRASRGFGVKAPTRGSGRIVTPVPLPSPTRLPDATVAVPAVSRAPRPASPVPGYESVPMVRPLPQIGGESFGDRTTRCLHQGGLGGLSTGQMGTYVPLCAQ